MFGRLRPSWGETNALVVDYATFTKLLAATQLFEMDHEGTSQVSVRDKRAKASRSN